MSSIIEIQSEGEGAKNFFSSLSPPECCFPGELTSVSQYPFTLE